MASLRESLGLDLVVTVYVVQSAQCTLNCRDPICSRQFSRVINRHSREYVRQALVDMHCVLRSFKPQLRTEAGMPARIVGTGLLAIAILLTDTTSALQTAATEYL